MSTAEPTADIVLAALAQALAEGDAATAEDLAALLGDPAAASAVLAELAAEPAAAREQTRGAWVMRGGKAVRV